MGGTLLQLAKARLLVRELHPKLLLQLVIVGTRLFEALGGRELHPMSRKSAAADAALDEDVFRLRSENALETANVGMELALLLLIILLHLLILLLLLDDDGLCKKDLGL